LLAGTLSAAASGWIGSQACAKCHAAIFRSYSVTAMARTSGPAIAGQGPEKFDKSTFDGNSGYRYSIANRDHKLVLGFRKHNGQLAESRDLRYFVGSGAAARSYLIDVGGFLYESPATYYSRSAAWNLSPGYQQYNYPFLTRAIAPDCLECHSTGVQ